MLANIAVDDRKSRQEELSDNNVPQFKNKYFKEASEVKKAVCGHLKYFKEESDRARKDRGADYNLAGSTMSHICCFVENQLLMIILGYLRERIGDVSGCILCFDGIMIPKEQTLGLSLSFLHDEIEERFLGMGFFMKLSIKDMKPICLGEFGFHPLKRYTYGGAPAGSISPPFNNFICREEELARQLENGDNEKDRERLLCRKSILYRDVDVIPHSPLESPSIDDTFNLYGSYVHKYDPNFAMDNELVSLWTDHIREVFAAGNKEIGQYLLNWFAHLLQKPQIKTQTVPLIKGEPRCGKNTPNNIFSRYVLNPYMVIVCPDMEKLFSRFNAARVGKSFIVLDEAVDSRNRALNNKMKNFITEERVQIEAKDRRYLCLEASSIRKGDRAYFKKFNKLLANVDAGCHIFHWLLQRDISNFDTADLPKTSYKKELSARQTDSVVKWLLFKYEMLKDNEHEDAEEFMLSPEWYQQYATWCRDVGGESKIHSLAVFNSIINNEGFETRSMKVPRGDGSRRTIKPRFISRAILEENLSDYIVMADE
ncbi:unnamed protein product [Phytophthora fragariaefolia]|uniref:Unnamed protein product n=1 Tax=Phytophthora fragariaefolia TaxID=1490495 RepID=A0A9W6U935_9STRA|nr:unnamed protein product [Phytophthora fragariaefolia]